MTEAALAVLYAIFLWWFSTGAILIAAGTPRWWHFSLVWGTAPLLALGLWAMGEWAAEASTAAVYYAFTGAIAIWGWHELSFLTGRVTGPRKAPCSADRNEAKRFRQAVAAILWHELALLATAVALVAVSWGQPNQFGVWTFLTLFAARISAKLNVYFGIPNLTEEFLPEAMSVLKTYFRKRPMNRFFPLAVTGLTFAVACWAERAYAASPGGWAEVGFALLTGLTALALIEHWLLVLPVPDAALWRWLLPPQDARRRQNGPPGRFSAAVAAQKAKAYRAAATD